MLGINNLLGIKNKWIKYGLPLIAAFGGWKGGESFKNYFDKTVAQEKDAGFNEGNTYGFRQGAINGIEFAKDHYKKQQQENNSNNGANQLTDNEKKAVSIYLKNRQETLKKILNNNNNLTNKELNEIDPLSLTYENGKITQNRNDNTDNFDF